MRGDEKEAKMRRSGRIVGVEGGWQGYKIRIYVCIASRILDPLSQESAVLEMELFESSFQPRLHVQVVSRSKNNCAALSTPGSISLSKSINSRERP